MLLGIRWKYKRTNLHWVAGWKWTLSTDGNQAFWWLSINVTQKSARNRKKQRSEEKLINIQWLICILTEKTTPTEFGDSSHGQYSSLQLPAKQIITDPNSSPSLHISMLWQTPRNRPSQSQGVRKNTVSATWFQGNFDLLFESILWYCLTPLFRSVHIRHVILLIKILYCLVLKSHYLFVIWKVHSVAQITTFNTTLLRISGRKVEVMTVFDPISRPFFFSLLSPVVTECINSQTFSDSSFQRR